MPVNPFLNRSMIRGLDAFYGRQREVQRVMARIGADPPQSVSVVGERRAGKSSLLWFISQPEVFGKFLNGPEQYVFLLLDFQGHQHLDPTGFCRVFGQQLREVVAGRMAVPELHGFTDVQASLQALARAGLRLVCLLDEFETVTRNSAFGSEFYGFLRSLANSLPVAFVTSSRRDLQSLCHNREIAESPFFNIFTRLHIGPMRPEETRQLIVEPSAGAGVALEAHIDQITALSGHLPFFVQIACSAAFDCLTEAGDGQLDAGLLWTRYMEEAESHFTYLCEAFNDQERRAVEQLARDETPAAERVPALTHLVGDGYVIEEAETYRLFSVAFKRFLLERVAAQPDQPGAKAKPAKAGSRKSIGEKTLIRGAMIAGPCVGLLFIAHDWLFDASTVPAPASSGPEIEAVAVAAAWPVAVDFYYRSGGATDRSLPLAAPPDAPLPVDLYTGDQFRLDLQVQENGYLHVYLVQDREQIVHLTDPNTMLPLAAQAGERYDLPPDPEQWFLLARGRQEVFLLLGDQRDRDLEERCQRLAQVPAFQLAQYRADLLREIATRARARFEFVVR